MKKLITAFGVMVLTGFVATAQPGRGNPGVNPAPLDGGISLLIAAGAALGGKKIYDARKSKEE